MDPWYMELDEYEKMPFGDWDVEMVARTLEKTTLLGRMFGKINLTDAASLLRCLWLSADHMEQSRTSAEAETKAAREELEALKEKLTTDSEALHAQIAEGERVSGRIQIAIKDMLDTGYRGMAKTEKPAAIVMSPYQVAALTMHGYVRPFERENRENESYVRTYKGVPVYSATGVYGPVVMTQKAFDGFSRMAPELNLKVV